MLSLLSLLWAGDLEEGVAALKAKKAEEAVAALSRCTTTDPAAVQCWWELGWARYLQRDWAKVIEAWTMVQQLQPDFPGLEKNLAQARSLQADSRAAAEARAKAPPTLAPRPSTGPTLRLRAVGDMMIGTDFPAGYLPEDGGKSTFDSVRSLLQDADLTFGNLEGPLCDIGETQKCKPDAAEGSCYAFRTPTSYGAWYKEAGFDLLSTANNHAGDFGPECRQATESTLDGLGIRFSGREGTVASLESNGLKVGMVGFATYLVTHDLNNEETAIALIQELSQKYDILIVSFHGGAEGSKATRVPIGAETFYGENRGDLRRFTHLAVDAGADLVLGHGPHVLRGMEVYKDRLIAYSLGNFATYGRFNLNGNQGIGVILEASLDATGTFLGGRLYGTRQLGSGIPTPDAQNTAADLVRLLTQLDFFENGLVVAQDGTIGKK